MARGRRLRDVEVYKRIMAKHKLIGLCKSQPLDRCIDCSTILTQEPSLPISWGQLNSLIALLVKVSDGEYNLTAKDKKYMKGHLSVFATAWNYMTEESPQKGIINAAMAGQSKRADGESSDGSTDAGTVSS